MGLFLRNIRLSTRVLIRNIGLSCWIILTLALAVGANVTVFSVVDSILLRPVNIRDPQNVVVIRERDPQGILWNGAAGNFLDWRDKATSFSGIAGSKTSKFVLTGLDRPVQVAGARVTDNLFSVLGVRALLGRTFQPGEDGVGRPGAEARIALITYQMWRGTFAGSPNVLERRIQLNGESYTIVGVLPPEFFLFARQFQADQPQVWVPLGFGGQDRDSHDILTYARLKVSRGQALSEMAALETELGREYPASNSGWSISVQGLLDYLVNGPFRTRLLLVAGAVGMVLVVACTNIAGLLLMWAVSRRREMAVRLAVGAGRGNLAAQFLTESLLLAIAGSVAGLILAWVLIRSAPALLPANLLPSSRPLELSGIVLGYGAGLGILAGILLGFAPALAGSRMQVASALREDSRGGTAKSSLRFRQVMVILQMGLALILLASGLLMAQSLASMMTARPGFSLDRTMAIPLYLPAVRYDEQKSIAFQRQLLEHLAAAPGVESVGIGNDIPLQRTVGGVPYDHEGSARTIAERPDGYYVNVTPGYFETLEIPLRAGRLFNDSDRAGYPLVIVVNQAFVRANFPGEKDVLGQKLVLNQFAPLGAAYLPDVHPEIVGVVGDVRLGPAAPEPLPMIYAPMAQNAWSENVWVVLRGRAPSSAFPALVRRSVSDLDAGLIPGEGEPFERMFHEQFNRPRFQVVLTGVFAALALVLAAIGIYGVQAQDVIQRTNEIGIRMAVGAPPFVIVREVLRRGIRLAALGIGAGLVGSVAAGTAIRSVLVDVSATDPATLGVVAGTLLIVAILACIVPAMRAVRIDPAAAVRRD